MISAGVLLVVDVVLHYWERRGAAGGCEVGRGPEVCAPQVRADVFGELLPEATGRHALEGADKPGQGNLGG